MGCAGSKVKEGGPAALPPPISANYEDAKSISVPLTSGILSPFDDLPVAGPPAPAAAAPSLPSDDLPPYVSEGLPSLGPAERVEAAKVAAAAIAACLPTSSSLYDTTAFADEAARMAELRSMLLDTSPESRFDSITELAAALFDVPICVVSLVDSARGWFKSKVGPFRGCVAREGSFCSYVLIPDFAECLIVEDATLDARFAENPFVKGPPHLRYYAGCPLVTSAGHRVGTLCLCDFRPRALPATAYNVMCNLAEIVVREMEREVVAARLEGDPAAVDSPQTVVVDGAGADDLAAPFCRVVPAAPAADEPLVMVNTADPAWPLVYCNEAWEEMVAAVGAAPAEGGPGAGNKGLWEVFAPVGGDGDPAALLAGARPGRTVDVGARPRVAGAGAEDLRLSFFQASRDQMTNAVPVSIPGFVPADEADCGERVTPAALPLGALWIGTARLVRRAPEEAPGTAEDAVARCTSVSSVASGATPGRRPWSPASSYSPRCSPEGMAPRRPRRLAALQLGPLLGQGSFGRVYRGSLKGKAVAVKVIEVAPSAAPGSARSSRGSSFLSSDAGSGLSCGGASSGAGVTAQQAVLEAALSRHLAHPNIVPTFDYIVQDAGARPGGRGAAAAAAGTQEVWIIQHLCDGGSLVEALERGLLREARSLTAPPSLPAVLATATEIASALAFLHESDLLHGDLSGNNVLLSSAPNARGWVALVSDFGLARAAPSVIHTQTTGTVTHMPPELLMDGILTKSADSYAFGVLLWEMWAGRRAYAGAALGNVIFQVTCRGKRLELPEDCPEPLRRLAASCMDPDREKRPTCAAAAAALEAMKRDLLPQENE